MVTDSAEAMDVDESKADEEGKMDDSNRAGAEKKEEPSTHQLSNPARVVPAQESLVSFPSGSRWQHLRSIPAIAGILVLKDIKPGKPPKTLNCFCMS